MQVVPVEHLDDLQTALELVARRGAIPIGEDEAFRAGRTIATGHKLAALIGYGNGQDISVRVILPLAEIIRNLFVNSELIRARLVEGELRKVNLFVLPVLEGRRRLLLLSVAVVHAHRRAGDELAIDGSLGSIVSRSHSKGELARSIGTGNHLRHGRGVGCRLGDRIGVLEFGRRDTGGRCTRRIDPLALELVLAIDLLAYRCRDSKRTVAVIRHDSLNRMDRLVVRIVRRLVVNLTHRIGERLAGIILSEGQPTRRYQTNGLGGVGLDICGLKDLAVRGNANLAGRYLVGRLDDITERALRRAKNGRVLGIRQRLLDLQTASSAIVEACRVTVHKRDSRRDSRRRGAGLTYIVLLHVSMRILLELDDLFVRQRARVGAVAQQLRHTRTLEHGRHGVELSGVVLVCKNLDEHDGIAGVASVIGVAGSGRLVLVNAIGKCTAKVLFRELAGKELLFPACAHHSAGHAGPCHLIGQAGLGAIDRRLNAVVPKARHGKGKLARGRGATLKGLAHRHAIKGTRCMVRVGKGSLVGYELVRIGGTGVGVGHARHAQLARVVARLIQIGHHNGRACGVLVHGHARLDILRSFLGDVEAKGACAVERHGRGGFGAKGERCHASRLGRAGDCLVGVNGNNPILHRLCSGFAQTSCVGIVRSGGKVKGIALALIPVTTAHSLLALQGHARGIHAIYIGKGGRDILAQLLYRVVFCGLVVLDRGLDASTLLGVAHHGVIDRSVVVVGHARNATEILSKPVHVGASRIRRGGIGDRRPRHRAVGVVAHGCDVALGALRHGGLDARCDRLGVERCVVVRIATHTLKRKAKGVLGKRERPGVVGQVLLSMDDDAVFVRIVAVGEGCDLIGNLCGSRFACVVAHLHHLHARNDQCTGAVIIHLDRRGIDGSGVAYAIRLGIGAGNILQDGIGVGTRLGIGNIAKRRRLGILGELDRRRRALGTVGHGGAAHRRKPHGKGIAIGPIATFEHLLGAQPILGVKRYRAGAVVVGKLEFVARRDLPVHERCNLALDGVASSRLLLAADLTAHEAKAGRKHRLFGGTGHGVDDTRQHVAVGRLALGSELAHAIAGTLLKAVYADGLAGLDGVGVAVPKLKGIAHSVAARIEHMRLVALLGLRQGELKRKRQILVIRILSGCSKTSICRHRLGHLQRCHATIGILHGRCRGKEMIELECAQLSTGLGGIVYIC